MFHKMCQQNMFQKIVSKKCFNIKNVSKKKKKLLFQNVSKMFPHVSNSFKMHQRPMFQKMLQEGHPSKRCPRATYFKKDAPRESPLIKDAPEATCLNDTPK